MPALRFISPRLVWAERCWWTLSLLVPVIVWRQVLLLCCYSKQAIEKKLICVDLSRHDVPVTGMAGVDQLNWHRGICDCYVDACSYQITARVLDDIWYSLQWHHDERDGVSNHQRIDCLHNCLFRRKSTKTPKLRVRPLWGEFTCHRWIPLIKGQLRGKCFNLMTSSCPEVIAGYLDLRVFRNDFVTMTSPEH